MSTNRLEAFSDGVLAIIITIMVLELKTPQGHSFTALRETTGTALLTYLLTFVYVGIYWNNHHHMFQLTARVTGAVLWANLALLFSISLFPFTTAWMDSDFARVTVAAYGLDLLAAAVAYFVLQTVIVRAEGAGSLLRRAIRRDLKGKASPVLYIAGLLCVVLVDVGRLGSWLGMAFFVAVAVMWLIPDRRIERVVAAQGGAGGPTSRTG